MHYIIPMMMQWERTLFKDKQSSLPTNFTPSKKDNHTIEEQIKEIKLRFENLNYRLVIGSHLYVSCCTRQDITYAVNKLANFSHNLGTVYFRA